MRQFIPQGAISFVEIAVVFVDIFVVMSISVRDYMSTSLFRPNKKRKPEHEIHAIGYSALL